MKPFERDLPLIRLLLQALILFCGEHLFQILLTAIFGDAAQTVRKAKIGVQYAPPVMPFCLTEPDTHCVIPAGRKSQVLYVRSGKYAATTSASDR